MSAWELTNIIIRLVLPPGVLIILGLLGAALARSRVRYGVGLALFSLIALYALSMPVVGFGLLRSLQPPYIDPVNDPNPGLIRYPARRSSAHAMGRSSSAARASLSS